MPRRYFVLCAVLTIALSTVSRADDPTRIVLIAGPITGHGKHTHEYEKNVILLKHLLETSPSLQGKDVQVEAHFHGWPEDESTLDTADTIFLTSDGGDHNEENHPLYVGDRLKMLEKQMQRGCGLVMFHWSTFHPARFHQKVTEWVGGYFDYETGDGPRKWYSAIQTWDAMAKPGAPDHPVCRGVKPFETREEWYYNIRFRDDDPRLKPIIVTRPPNVDRDHTVGWAVERENGGRGFGFTGGHFYSNWWNDDFRRTILNAIVWTAGLDVPDGGVQSTLDEPIKALIITGHNHPAHKWRETTKALIEVLELDPRMMVNVTEDPEELANDSIHEYDVLVQNYSSWDRDGLSEAARKNFVKYLQNGGGLSVIHFANGSWTETLPNEDADWEEYRTKIVRRRWVHGEGNSSHDAYGPFQVEISAAGSKHPITSGLDAFDTVDELYYRQMGPLPIVPLATAVSKDTKQPEPMAFAYDYGKGTVFQTVLGHADVSIRKAAPLIRRGTVWAAKRDNISWDPPRELADDVMHRAGSPWTIEESLKRAGETSAAKPQTPSAEPIVESPFGNALNGPNGGVFTDARREFREPPITVECRVKLDDPQPYNILVANELKSSATHWEMFSQAGNGQFTVYIPGHKPDHVRSSVNICDGKWHHVAMLYEPKRLRLFVDGRQVADESIEFGGGKTVVGDLAVGSLVSRNLGCSGLIDDVRISRGIRRIDSVPANPLESDDRTIALWNFDKLDDSGFADQSGHDAVALLAAVKKK